MSTTPSSYAFLSWVRQGLGSLIPQGAQVGNDTRVQLPVTLTLEGAATGSVNVSMLGPGDITGIDKRVIIRTEPPALNRNLEPNYFPFVEFDRPDFPWLFTPKGPETSAKERMLPWIFLVVIATTEGSLDTSGPTPVLTIDPLYLPRLDQSWAWAHVQVAGYDPAVDTDIQALITQSPERVCSRIICPRKLEPNTAYHACLVPTFEAGRLAGLPDSKAAGTEHLQPAWTTPTQAGTSVKLPVYHSFEFSTGQAGDFESLVRKLVPRSLDSTVGVKRLGISDPGCDVGPLASNHPMAVVGMVGALKGVDTPSDQTVSDPDDTYATYIGELLELLNSGAEFTSDLVTPPLYGRWHGAARQITENEAQTPAWLRELNLTPWHRAAGGLGAIIVEENQRALMTSAWEQAGDLVEVNKAKRQAALSARLVESKHRRWFKNLSWQKLLQTTGPAHSRLVPDGSDQSVRGQLEDTKFQRAVISTAMRKLTRRRGPMARRFNQGNEQTDGFDTLVDRVRSETARPLPEERFVRGMRTMEEISAELNPDGGRRPFDWNEDDNAPVTFSGMHTGIFEELAADEDNDNESILRTGGTSTRGTWSDVSPSSTPSVRAFARAMAPHILQLARQRDLVRSADSRPLLGSGDAQSLADAITECNPAAWVKRRLSARTFLPETVHQSTQRPFARTLVGPTFPQPMYEALRSYNPEFILAGAGAIPANTVGLLTTNRAFIEAFMVGLNHSMSREFLWQEYPADLRATYFTQFWDALDADPDEGQPEDAAPPADITAINTWARSSELADEEDEDHNPSASPDRKSAQNAVLLIRGELLQRYPRTVIYVAEASAGSPRQLTAAVTQSYPIFRATLGTDITCLGFQLTVEDLLGNDTYPNGWFFVLEEQPTEPRFGLDAKADTDQQFGATGLAHWPDLDWTHVVNTGEQYSGLKNIDLATSTGLNTPQSTGLTLDGVTWGKNSASMASITYQKPFRIAIHADDLIGES